MTIIQSLIIEFCVKFHEIVVRYYATVAINDVKYSNLFLKRNRRKISLTYFALLYVEF